MGGNIQQSMADEKELSTLTEFRSLRQTATEKQAYASFVPRAPQLFAARFVAPHTPVQRAYIAYEVGTGKTLSAILAAVPYIEGYRRAFTSRARELLQAGVPVREARSSAARAVPQVTVIGFTADVFKAELARHPAFGVASPEELQEYRRVLAALRGDGAGVSRAQLEQTARNMAANFKRRMVSKLRGGFWRFVGYQELVLKLFPVMKREIRDMGQQAEEEGRRVSELIDEAEEAGDLEVNRAYLASFADNFCVCDEVHHAYNSKRPNNWGVAVRYVLEQHAEVRAVFMTATPCRGSPAEIVDLANLLRLPGEAPMKKSDLFRTAGETAALRKISLRPGALSKIRDAFRGRVLHYRMPRAVADQNIRDRESFRGAPPDGRPRVLSAGEPLPGKNSGLTFSVSRAGAQQNSGYVAVLNAKVSPAAKEGVTILMGAVPMPSQGKSATSPSQEKSAPERPPIALSARDFAAIVDAPAAWRRKTGIAYNADLGALAGDAIASAAKLRQYSAKLAWLVAEVGCILRKHPGEKIMIFTSRVRGLGVETVAEVLRRALGVQVLRTPAEMREATVQSGRPKVRAMVAHSYLETGGLERRLEMFNRADNAEGALVTILVAGEVLEEGREVKCVRHHITLDLPDDIPSYKQLRGRVDRFRSHEDLPPAKRTVRYYIAVTEFDVQGHGKKNAGASEWALRYGKRGWDVDRWLRAMDEFEVIKQVERAVQEAAPSQGAQDPDSGKKSFLEPLALGPQGKTDTAASAAAAARNSWNYYAFGYDKQTVRAYAAEVRGMFMERPVWRYADLIAAAQGEHSRSRMLSVAPRTGDTAPYDPAALPAEDLGAAVASLMREQGVSAPAFAGDAARGIALVRRGEFIVLEPPGSAETVDDYDFAAAAVFATEDGAPPAREPAVNVTWFANTVKRRYNFQVQRDAWMAEIEKIALPGRRDTAVAVAARFDEFTSDFHYSFLRELLENRSTMVDAATFRRVRPTALAAYAAFGFVVSPARVKKVMGVDGVGYLEDPVVHVYSNRKRAWTEHPRDRLAPRRKRKEAAMVGLYESAGDDGSRLVTFKLRNGGALDRPRGGDRRTLERGIACGSKKKDDVLEIADTVKVPASVRGNSSVRDLCRGIKTTLLKRELEAGDAGPRFFWMFNEGNQMGHQ